MSSTESKEVVAEESPMAEEGGRRHHRHGITAKKLKKVLKKAGLKVSGKVGTLKARARKAHLMRGGGSGAVQLLSPAGVDAGAPAAGGRRRTHKHHRHGGKRHTRKHRGVKWF